MILTFFGSFCALITHFITTFAVELSPPFSTPPMSAQTPINNTRRNGYVPDCLFPSNNGLEIPSLRLDVQPAACEIPFLCFGEQKRTHDMGGVGTLHFYTDDYRFSGIWDHPEKILQHNPANIVEPNFSLFNETPVAFGLQAVYKKRFIGRAMQEQGIGVFVDLNVANKFYAFNLIGIPKGYGSFCTRGYEDRIPSLEFEYEMAQKIADGNPLTFVVYGGGEVVKTWCRKHEAVYVTPIIAIKNKIKSIERMRRNVAFIAPDQLQLPLDRESMSHPMLPSNQSLYDNQVIDYSIKLIK